MVGKFDGVNNVFYREKYGILGDYLLDRRGTAPILRPAAHPSGSCRLRPRIWDGRCLEFLSKVGFYHQAGSL